MTGATERIGRLRHRVLLQAPAGAADGGGGTVAAWSDVATVWAAIAPLTGRERVQAEQVAARASHRVTIRWRAGVTAAMRLSMGARAFAIRAVLDPDGRRRWLELACEEGAP